MPQKDLKVKGEETENTLIFLAFFQMSILRKDLLPVREVISKGQYNLLLVLSWQLFPFSILSMVNGETPALLASSALLMRSSSLTLLRG
jgi:hypothetical protein